jgi:FixJ family two-component response regulator
VKGCDVWMPRRKTPINDEDTHACARWDRVMNTPPATIYIVDDDSEVQRALGRRLRAVRYEVCALGSAAEFLAERDREGVGCIILDVASCELGGLQLQESLVASKCRRPIIFLCGNGDIAMIVRAMKAGAVNCLTKPVDDQKLALAVEEALRIDAERHAARSLRHGLERRLALLTPRERQVLEGIAAGRLNKQIAATLGTVEQTIKVHRANVMRKLGARSVADLVWLVACAGIIPQRGPGNCAIKLPRIFGLPELDRAPGATPDGLPNSF